MIVDHEVAKFIRECRRELLRRERQSTIQVSGDACIDWDGYFVWLREKLKTCVPSPIRQGAVLRDAFKRLQLVSFDDRAHLAAMEALGKRNTTLSVITLRAGPHPLHAVEGSCLAAYTRQLGVDRRHAYTTAAIPVAVISAHALGRLAERSGESFAPRHVASILAYLGMLGVSFAKVDRNRDVGSRSFILKLVDIFFVGAIRRVEVPAVKPGQVAIDTIVDVRSVLEESMITADELRVALAVERAFSAVVSGEYFMMDQLVASVPRMPARPDFIAELLKEESK